MLNLTFATTTKMVVGTTTATQTRANNAVAYAAGQVFGGTADARFTIVAPALPADAVFGWQAVGLTLIHGTGSGQGTLNLNVYLFSALPATVLGDAAAFALSDADTLLVMNNARVSSDNQCAVAGGVGNLSQLNQAATVAGRRVRCWNGAGAPLAGVPIAGGASLGVYLVANAAYTPLAQETLRLTPTWQYTVRQQ